MKNAESSERAWLRILTLADYRIAEQPPSLEELWWLRKALLLGAQDLKLSSYKAIIAAFLCT